ncbi:unnamed protein product [Calicophoron daubneyi]|uniref:Uncharacterized protein n=1 Tax=Calicophoron daubneyi TaxID=300641 RepID=A0AAV2TXW5_CALDB
MQKQLAEMSGRIERMESLIAKVSEQCEDIKQSLACVHGETKIVSASTSSWPTVPAYTMEQLIALDHRLVERSFYMGLVRPAHGLYHFSERPTTQDSGGQFASFSSQFTKQNNLSINTGGDSLHRKKQAIRF